MRPLVLLSVLLPLVGSVAAETVDDHVQLRGTGVFVIAWSCTGEFSIVVERLPVAFNGIGHLAFLEVHPAPDCPDYVTFLGYRASTMNLGIAYWLVGDWEHGFQGASAYGTIRIGPYGNGQAIDAAGEIATEDIWWSGTARDNHLDELMPF